MFYPATKYGILVAIDGSPASDAAVAWACREAVSRRIPITLMHVVAPIIIGWPVGQLYTDMPEWQKANAQDVIEQSQKILAACLDESEAPEVHTELLYFSAAPTLIEASKDASMVVVGDQGMGALGRLLLGSVSTALIQHAYCPVAVIRSGQETPSGPKAPVLVGIDGSAASDAATALAFDEASRRRVELVALHAGATSECSRPSAWTGMTARVKERKSWLNAWPVGTNSIQMSACGDCSSATSRPGGCSTNPRALNWWSSAVVAEADFPACCWAR